MAKFIKLKIESCGDCPYFKMANGTGSVYGYCDVAIEEDNKCGHHPGIPAFCPLPDWEDHVIST